MALEHVDRFVTLAFAGTGLLLAGGVNLLTPAGRVGLRTGLTLLIAGAAIAAVGVWTEDPAIAGQVAALLAVLLLPCLLGGKGFQALARVFGAAFGRPATRWGSVAAVGLALVIGSATVFEVEDEAWAVQDSRDAMAASALSSHVEVKGVRAATDRGTEVVITQCPAPRDRTEVNTHALNSLRSSGHIDHVIHRQPAGEHCNCHGWVFTNGQYGLNGEWVDRILAENDYQAVTAPRPDDLVIYRHPDGRPSHTAVVRYVTEGQPVLVEGKWGWMGVYLHAVDRSIYGISFTYYRSPRSGHLLRLSSLDAAPTAP